MLFVKIILWHLRRSWQKFMALQYTLIASPEMVLVLTIGKSFLGQTIWSSFSVLHINMNTSLTCCSYLINSRNSKGFIKKFEGFFFVENSKYAIVALSQLGKHKELVTGNYTDPGYISVLLVEWYIVKEKGLSFMAQT